MPSTRFSSLSRPSALALLAATVLAIVVLLVVALRPDVAAQPGSGAAAAAGVAGTGDTALYAAIMGRMQRGEGYYPAAHAEMLAQGYGTASVLNWRTPFYPTLLAALGPSFAQAVLALAAIVAGALGAGLVWRESGRPAALLFAVLALLSLAAVAAPGTVYFSEIAAGVLILGSVAAAGLGFTVLAVAAGLLALFIRELSGLYVLVALGFALAQRRRGEAMAWIVGLVAYAAYFGWHALNVHAQLGPGDPAYPAGWLQFGGLGFVLHTAQVDGVLFALPLWVTALVLPPALLGLAGWRGRAAPLALATVVAYLAAFLVVGKPFDVYWGAVYTPLLGFGLAALPACLADLVADARRPRAL